MDLEERGWRLGQGLQFEQDNNLKHSGEATVQWFR